ncbi:hypothetical protein ABGF48_03290 [Helcococcus bovis]|uniref:hypothetical protein n=1 Tax=Helcococcus bovis TaxID=3153252 RepID=UPI0038B76E2F
MKYKDKELVDLFLSLNELGEIERQKAEFLLLKAETQVLAYTNRKELIPEMRMLVLELATYHLLSKDRQGIASRSEGPMSETYINLDNQGSGIPKFIELSLNRFRLLHVVKHNES